MSEETSVTIQRPVNIVVQSSPDVTLRNNIIDSLYSELTSDLLRKSEQCGKDIEQAKKDIAGSEKSLVKIREAVAVDLRKAGLKTSAEFRHMCADGGYDSPVTKVSVELNEIKEKPQWSVYVSARSECASRYSDEWVGFQVRKVVDHTPEYKEEGKRLDGLKTRYSDLLTLKAKLDTAVVKMPQMKIIIDGTIARRDIQLNEASEQQYGEVRDQLMKIIPRGLLKLLGE